MEDDAISRKLSPLQSDPADFFRHQLTEFHPRDDYRALLQLSLIFFGAGTADIQIHAPDAYHKACCGKIDIQPQDLHFQKLISSYCM